MLEVLFVGMVIAFGVGLNVGVLFLLFFSGPKLRKRFPWMKSIPWIQEEPTLDWVNHPFRSILSLASGFLTLMLCSILWPVIAFGIFRGRDREKEELLQTQRAEFESLLQEIHSDREGSNTSLPKGTTDP